MAKSIALRQGTLADYTFALAVYLSTMRPYTEELMIWNEQRQIASFARQWKLEDVRIICVDGSDVGWLQAEETPSEIVLHQLFVAPVHQRVGIGTEVLASLLASWGPIAKPIVLTVLKNNPARRLYERFGFHVVGEVGVKLQMRARLITCL